MLAPVTTAKSGRLPEADQPERRPAPKAPSAPPPDNASHGPFTLGNTRLKSSPESPHARASAMPATTAAVWSSRLKGVRAVDSCGVCLGACLGGALGAF